MPTYEYQCEKCGKSFEAFRECPKALCREKKWGHGRVKRLLGTGAGLIFKGSGFYTTDYRSNSYKDAAKKDAPAAASSEKSDSAKETGAKTLAKSTSSAEKTSKKETAA
jgi:putative FmdB family regulatory protein